MAYDAITIDTNTFIHSGIALETGLLGQLEQFKDAPVDLILPEIVTREVLKHLQQITKDGRDRGLAVLTRLEQLQLVPEADREGLKELAHKVVDSRDAARQRLARFLEATGAETVRASLCSIEELVKLYFAASPPFEPSGSKKSEFPDAIALLSLQKWALDGGKRILAVSEDKGWAAFAERSEQIDVEKDLGKALETLQEHAAAAEAAVANFMEAIVSGALPDIATTINDGLTASLADWVFAADGSSSFFFEPNSTVLRFGSYELEKNGDDYDITVVRLGNELVTARIGVTFTATAEADFSLAIWDGVDREYVGMGNASAESKEEFEGAFLITIYGDLGGLLGEVEVGDIEVVEAIDSVDFGEIEFDYGDPDDFEALLEFEAEAVTGEEPAGPQTAADDL
jgi:PIN domain